MQTKTATYDESCIEDKNSILYYHGNFLQNPPGSCLENLKK